MNNRAEYLDSIREVADDYLNKTHGENKRATIRKINNIKMIIEKVSDIYLQEINESEVISKKSKTTAQLKQKYSSY